MDQFFTFLMHHWELSSVFVLLLIAVIAFEARGTVKGVMQLSPAQLVGVLNHKGGVLIDVRDGKSFTEGHIAGAMNFPADNLMNSLKKLHKYKAKPLVLCCAAGHASMKSAENLRQEGYAEVYNLTGGVSVWKAADMPLVKGR